jgi:hypothetical protein
MARIVINYNGISVYSDLAFAGSVGHRIIFNDGSWCDTLTGEIVNRGRGYIAIIRTAEQGGPDGASCRLRSAEIVLRYHLPK